MNAVELRFRQVRLVGGFVVIAGFVGEEREWFVTFVKDPTLDASRN